MRLTLALLKRKMPNGNIWIGKHRLAHHIYPDNIQRMALRLQVEEKNMLLLRHPYLSVEQERSGHAKVLNKNEDWMANKKLEHASSRVHRSVRLEDKFDHLFHGSNWDPSHS